MNLNFQNNFSNGNMNQPHINNNNNYNPNFTQSNTINNNVNRQLIENILYIKIEFRKTINKINCPFNKNNNFEKYFIINLEYFNEYLKCKNLYQLFYNNAINNKIKILIYNNNALTVEEILKIILADNNLINEINKIFSNGLSKNNNSVPNNIKIEPQIEKANQFIYYTNFILLTDYSVKKLFGSNPIHLKNSAKCLFGGNMILFLFNNSDFNHFAEFYELNGKLVPKLILNFYTVNNLNESMKLLLEKGFEQYHNFYLMFKNDYASPIFNDNNKEIGYAYVYNPNTQDYSNYLLNKKLISFIKYFFNYIKFNLNQNKQKNGRYYLINKEFISEYKKYYNYILIESILNQIEISNQIIIELSKEENNPNNILNDKKVAIIIKNDLYEINKKFNSMDKIIVTNIREEPDIKIIQGTKYYYYDNFELIDEDIYESLFLNYNNENNKNNEKNNIRECYFGDNYLYFALASSFCDNKNPRNIEICILNKDNTFSANYLIECNKIDSFKTALIIAKKVNGFDNYFSKIEFVNITGQLYDGYNKPIGLIYKLKNPIINQYQKDFNILNSNKNLFQISNQNMNQNSNQKMYQNNNQNSNQKMYQTNNQSINQNISQDMNLNINQNINQNMNQNINQNIYQDANHNMNQIMNKNSSQNMNQNSNQKAINLIQDSPTDIARKKDLKKDFPLPPLIGLKNVGATCYMNATLQCLSQIQKLTLYFKYHKHVEDVIKKYKAKNENCLTASYKYLIENLWPSNSGYQTKEYCGKNSNNLYFSPEAFKIKISNMNELFKGVQANDAKDLINFIIMTLHSELNKNNKNQNTNLNIFIDQKNEISIFNAFLQNFMAENKSIISDIFYGVTHTIMKCTRCNFLKHNFELYFFLVFPLEEIRKYKLQQLINQNMNLSNQNMMYQNFDINQLFQQNLNKIQLLQNNKVNIFDCFDYNQKEENFCGENAMYCNDCNMQLPTIYQTLLYSAPEILILVLNRGAGIQFKIQLEFYEEINLSNYIHEKGPIIYDLISVVTHMGESGSNGHFIATCKSPIDNNWYQYNDDLVFKINNFKSQILDYAMPYILFYQKR